MPSTELDRFLLKFSREELSEEQGYAFMNKLKFFCWLRDKLEVPLPPDTLQRVREWQILHALSS